MADSENEYEAEWGNSDDSDQNDGRSQGEVDIENAFYEGDGIMKNKPAEALSKFLTVIELEASRPMNFAFKAATKVVILSMKTKDYDKMIHHTKLMF